MESIQIEAEPKDVGLDAERLTRIERHFQSYVDDGRLAGWLVAVARRGRVAYLATYGTRDIEAGLPVEVDTLVPDLLDDQTHYLGRGDDALRGGCIRAHRPREPIHPLLRGHARLCEWLIARAGHRPEPRADADLAPAQPHLGPHVRSQQQPSRRCDVPRGKPRSALLVTSISPPSATASVNCRSCSRRERAGTIRFRATCWAESSRWPRGSHSMSSSRGRIFEPLGMTDTSFGTPAEKLDRLAALYAYDAATGRAVRDDERAKTARSRPLFLSGGGGLVSSATDYNRFTQMLLGEGELDGVRLLGPRTIRYMTQNHLPGGVDLEEIGQKSFSETRYNGVGFGLGFSVVVNPAKYKVLSSAGEFAWGGAASTAFWVDPKEQLTALFMTQLTPSSSNHIRPELKQLVYQSIVD